MISGIGQEFSKNIKAYEAGQEKNTTDLLRIVELADETRLLAFRNDPKAEKVNGTQAYRYDLMLEKANIIAFLRAVEEESRKSGGGFWTQLNPGSLVAEAEGVQGDVLDFLSENLFVTLWTDASGMPIMGQMRLRAVPGESARHLPGKQFEYAVTMIISKINQPINVEVPDKFISATEADKLLESSTYGSPMLEARQKGADASVKATVMNMRVNIETLYTTNYSPALKSDNKNTGHGDGILKGKGSSTALLDAVQAQGSIMYAITNSGPTDYAIYGRLISDPTKYFCVDSKGGSATETINNKSLTCIK